mgnify:FL=1
MATSLTPSSFTVTGSGFTSNGSVTIETLNSSGSVVASASTTADSSGNISVTLPSSQISSIGQYTSGTYTGSVVAVDQFTGKSSSPVSITLTVQIVQPTITLSTTSFSYIS